MKKILFISIAIAVIAMFLAIVSREATAPGTNGGTANTTTNSATYDCPSSTTVNCMPIVTPERQPFCTGEYIQWATDHCPGFGVTY